MDADGRKLAFDQQTVELLCSHGRTNKDTNLVEFKRIEQLVQLAVLVLLFQLDIVLLQPMKRQLCLVVDKDFQRLILEKNFHFA